MGDSTPSITHPQKHDKSAPRPKETMPGLFSDLLLFKALPLTLFHLQNYCCLGILHELKIKAAEPSSVFEGKML